MRRLALVIVVFLIAGTAFAQSSAQAPSRITELNAQEKARLEWGRTLIQRYLPNDGARKLYQTAPGKLGTLRAIMKIEYLHGGRKDLLEALGVVLGDAFVQDMGFHWVAVEDEQGRHVAIRFQRRNIFLYPLVMIAERIRRGERVDALDLYNEAAAAVEDQIGETGRGGR